MLRPKLFVDTNVCINVANGHIPADEWRRVQEHIASDYDYYISFVTMKELFVRLARCKDEFFLQNRESLNALLGPGERFLPYPSTFALRNVLGFHSFSRKGDTHSLSDESFAESVLKAVLEAPSKAQLKVGIPIRNTEGWTQRFDLDHFDQHENQPQVEFAYILQGIRDDRNDMPEPMSWAAGILTDHGFTPQADQCKKLRSALDAAYTFTCTLSEMTKNENYSSHKNATNWGDAVQLFYLCDDSMHFLTFDGRCQTHACPSKQASRILVYREFVQAVP